MKTPKPGDNLRLLMIPMPDGSFTKFLKYNVLILDGGRRILYDETDFTQKLYLKCKRLGKKVSFGTIYTYLAYNQNDKSVDYYKFGRTLNVECKNYDFSYKGSDKLPIFIDEIPNQNWISPIKSYDKTKIVNDPILTFGSNDEYLDFIRKSVKDIKLFDLIDKLHVRNKNNQTLLKDEFGDVVLDLISEERDSIINKILE
jgi:hypothetical protein